MKKNYLGKVGSNFNQHYVGKIDKAEYDKLKKICDELIEKSIDLMQIVVDEKKREKYLKNECTPLVLKSEAAGALSLGRYGFSRKGGKKREFADKFWGEKKSAKLPYYAIIKQLPEFDNFTIPELKKDFERALKRYRGEKWNK